MDDLPDLPFEKVLSYLSLEELIKARAVSRRWYHKISSFRVKRLCYSAYPRKFIAGTSRPVSRAFAPSLIISPRFTSFFNTFGRSILSNLRHLHLHDLRLNRKNRTGFARTINTFGQLEELSIINAGSHPDSNSAIEFELHLPMLTSIQLEDLNGIKQLTLDAPNLAKVKLVYCSLLKLDLVHPESVERLVTFETMKQTKKLVNLKYFYGGYRIDSTFLSDHEQLKEIHLFDNVNILELFEQKRRLGRADLKIYIVGLLLSGPNDPAIDSFDDLSKFFGLLAENQSRLADEILYHERLNYSYIESVSPESAINVLSRFTLLREIAIYRPVQDVQRFLDLLKNLDNIVKLEFWDESQPQDLFDLLSEHCALQELVFYGPPSDFQFLFGLKQHLTALDMSFSIDIELIRRVLDELHLARFDFSYDQEAFLVRTDKFKPFNVGYFDNIYYPNYNRRKWTLCSDRNAVIEHILKVTQK